MFKKYEAIIFDCDGVLVDSEVLSAKAWVELLASYAIVIPVTQILNDFQGGNIHSSLEYIINLIGPVDKIELEKMYRTIVNLMFQDSLKAIEGIYNFLDKSSLKRCIASNGPKEKIIENLEITKLSSFFENHFIFSGHDMNSFKPEPDLFLHSAHQMEIDPADCVVIEDSKNGIIAAQRAGIDVIYYNAHQTTLEVSPTAAFASMNEIYDFIHKSNGMDGFKSSPEEFIP